jgi:hypothetical protein
MLLRMDKDFPDAPPAHGEEGREPAHVSVDHSNDEDSATMFASNSPAGGGQVLPYQESLSRMDTNTSTSDRTNAPVRQGFRVCKHLCLPDLDDHGIRAFFETFRLALLLPSYWYPGDEVRYAIRGHRHTPSLPYPKTDRNT